MRKLFVKNKLIVALIAFTLMFVAIGLAMFTGKNVENGKFTTRGIYTAFAEEPANESGDKTLKEVKAKVSSNGKYLLLVSAFDDSFLKEDGLYYIGYKYTFNGQEVDTTQLGEGAKTSTYYGSVALNTSEGVVNLGASDIYNNADYADYSLIVYEIEFENSFEQDYPLLYDVRAFINEVEDNGEGGFDVIEGLESSVSKAEPKPVLVSEEVVNECDIYTLDNKDSITIDFAENVQNPDELELTYSAKLNGQDVALDGTSYTFNFGTYNDQVQEEIFTVTVAYGEGKSIEYTYKLAIVDSTDYRLYNGGFENGMDGWTKVGNIGDVDTAKNYWLNDPENAEGYAFGMDGDKMFSAYAVGALESAVGTLTSSTFIVGGSGFVTYKVGAMRDGNYVYVDVVDANSKVILARFYNGLWQERTNDVKSGCTLIEYKADLSQFAGREVFFRISDNANSGYGLFFADSFNTYYAVEPSVANVATPVDYAVSGTIYDVFNGGFEMGNNQGWWNDAEIGVVTNASEYWGGSYGKDGKYLYTGVESTGANTMREGNQGTFTSSVFEIGGSGYITYMLGGGGNQMCYVQIIDSTTNEVLAKYRQQAQQDALLIKYVANLSTYIGRTVRFQIVDYASSDWGCVSFDNLVTYHTAKPEGFIDANDIKSTNPYEITNGSFETGDLTGWNMNITEAGGCNTLGWVQSSEHDAGWYTKNDNRKDGNYLFTFCKPDGTNCENTKGTLTSSTFMLKQGSFVSFRFGAAGTRDVYIQLCRANGEVIATFYNEAPGKVNTEMYAYFYQYNGATMDCFFRVVDNSVSNYGCLVLDDFRVNLTSAPDGFIQAIQ